MFGRLGIPELLILLVIALIIFGPEKLPEMGKSLGRSISEFKKATEDLGSSGNDNAEEKEEGEE